MDLEDFVRSLMPAQDEVEVLTDMDFPLYCTGCEQVKPVRDFITKSGRQYIYCDECRKPLRDRITPDYPQTDKCECCGVSFTPDVLACRDHVHGTTKFRGWTCVSCNSGVGFFRNSIERLQLAIDYLKRKQPPQGVS